MHVISRATGRSIRHSCEQARCSRGYEYRRADETHGLKNVRFICFNTFFVYAVVGCRIIGAKPFAVIGTVGKDGEGVNEALDFLTTNMKKL